MKFFFILLLFLCICPLPVFASRQVSITSNKTTLQEDEIMSITASCSGFTQGEEIIIKGVFFQSGSTNYFGYTHSDDQWIKAGSNTDDQKHIYMDAWDGHIEVKNDPDDSGFKGSGTYAFKVGYYYNTSGGNRSSVHWSDNDLVVSLIVPTPTLTPVPATSTPKPTSSPYPTITPIPTIIIEPTSSMTKKELSLIQNTPEISETENLLGIATDAAGEMFSIASPTGKKIQDFPPSPDKKNYTYAFPLIALSISIVLCLIASIWALHIWKQKKDGFNNSL